MKKLLFTTITLSTFIFANINAIVSILPEKTFVQAIGGDKVDVTLMVLPGNSPHTYEPKPSQMRAVAKAQLYFAIGVEFEKVWLPKFKDLNPSMKIVDLSQGIEKLPMVSRAHHNDAHAHHNESTDPHIWTAPKNVARIAHNIYNALVKADAPNSAFYKKNLERFLAHIARTDATIKERLSHAQHKSFMVFHPSWGYFAKAYGLTQIPVEVEGKAPKPRELVKLIQKARKEKVSAIFTQPEFSDASAKIIANELHIPVKKVSPLAPNWSQNLIDIASAIAGVR